MSKQKPTPIFIGAHNRRYKIKQSTYKTYDELPLFLNAKDVAGALGISKSKCYEMLGSGTFPTLKMGGRILVPKEKFILWVEENMQGGGAK